MSDYDLTEARLIISTLQTSLDRATARVGELQTTVSTLTDRVAAGNEQIENLSLDLLMELLRGENGDSVRLEPVGLIMEETEASQR
jgi:ABC-type transporter Mla subunit MlaD